MRLFVLCEVCLSLFWCLIASAEVRVISGAQTLAADQTWDLDGLELKADAEIRTNGYRLTIRVSGDLRTQDGAKIIRGPTPLPSPAPVPDKAAKGISFNPGPDSEGGGVRRGGKAG